MVRIPPKWYGSPPTCVTTRGEVLPLQTILRPLTTNHDLHSPVRVQKISLCDRQTRPALATGSDPEGVWTPARVEGCRVVRWLSPAVVGAAGRPRRDRGAARPAPATAPRRPTSIAMPLAFRPPSWGIEPGNPNVCGRLGASLAQSDGEGVGPAQLDCARRAGQLARRPSPSGPPAPTQWAECRSVFEPPPLAATFKARGGRSVKRRRPKRSGLRRRKAACRGL